MAVVCPRCRTPHHSRCWKENGGCARPGCRQLAVAVTLPEGERPRAGAASAVPWWKRPVVLAAALAAVLLALTLAFLTSRPATAPVPTVRLMTWATPEQADALQRAVDRFNAAHPEVRARLDVTPYMAYEQKLIVLIAARDAPDVFALSTSRLSLYARQGALLDLTGLWQKGPRSLKDAVFTGRLDPFYVDGKLWALPHPFSDGALVISSQTRTPDAAWELLRFVLEELPPPVRPPEPPAPLVPGVPGPGPFGGF